VYRIGGACMNYFVALGVPSRLHPLRFLCGRVLIHPTPLDVLGDKEFL
jgi:hypothetical protein